MISTQLSVLQLSQLNNFGAKMFCWTNQAGAAMERTRTVTANESR